MVLLTASLVHNVARLLVEGTIYPHLGEVFHAYNLILVLPTSLAQ